MGAPRQPPSTSPWIPAEEVWTGPAGREIADQLISDVLPDVPADDVVVLAKRMSGR